MINYNTLESHKTALGILMSIFNDPTNSLVDNKLHFNITYEYSEKEVIRDGIHYLEMEIIYHTTTSELPLRFRDYYNITKDSKDEVRKRFYRIGIIYLLNWFKKDDFNNKNYEVL